ncbi:uncharacterized protein J3R85_003010 [Psidium guajava]|nr:uncharacterized protein J3R85_003010 [Psidium guajava]
MTGRGWTAEQPLVEDDELERWTATELHGWTRDDESMTAQDGASWRWCGGGACGGWTGGRVAQLNSRAT